jgi:hypothetical protein
MPRHTDGSLMTKEEENEANIKRFNEALAAGNLYNTGPVGESGTSFSPDRWDAYFKKNPDVKPEGYTNQKDIQEKLDAGEDVTEELFGYELLETPETFPIGTEVDGKRTYEYMGQQVDEDGNPIEETDAPVQVRGLEGNRDPKTGDFLTEKSDMAKEIAQDIETEKTIEADTYADENEFDTTVAGWITQFKALSEEDFRDIDRQDLVPLGQNAVDAYFDVLDIHDAADDREKASLNKEFDWQGKAKGPLTDEERDTLVQEDVAREDAKFDDQLEGAESDRAMMEADADADKLDADYEASEFPMMGMSDEDKGMFSFQKTDTISNKKQQDSINTIVGDTGMNEEQARQLMTKLKGICG